MQSLWGDGLDFLFIIFVGHADARMLILILRIAPTLCSFTERHQRAWSWSSVYKVAQISCTEKVIYEHGAVKRGRGRVTGESLSVLRVPRPVLPGLTLCSRVKVQFVPVSWHLKHKTQRDDFIICTTWQLPMLAQTLAGRILSSEFSNQM